ncbi:RraA family protein [Nonomuraea sp. H19]|uniref:RraA family protein n=1 Tax=Nonomuraea sp. H19 TaxID=3452206 RepID=UPI003F8A20CA
MNDRFLELSTAVVADALDELGCRDQTLSPGIAALSGGGSKMAGHAATVTVVAANRMPDRPYALQFEAVDELRTGEVMVVQAPADTPAAFWGELISTRASARGCAGALVDGYCRDVEVVRAMGFPVWARGVHPADSKGRLEAVAFGAPVWIGGVRVCQGDLVLCDEDGCVVVPAGLLEAVLERAEAKLRTERQALGALRSGATLADTYQEFGVM